MIKGITSSGKHIIVSGGSPSSMYLNSFAGQSMVGQMRWNPNTQNTEVYDGNSWISMPSNYPMIQMMPDAERAIDWAIRKEREDRELLALCEKHPGLKEAYEKFLVMQALVTVEKKEETK